MVSQIFEGLAEKDAEAMRSCVVQVIRRLEDLRQYRNWLEGIDATSAEILKLLAKSWGLDTALAVLNASLALGGETSLDDGGFNTQV